MQCGLLGKTLGHSYSPQIHALLGDYSYRLVEKQPQELAEFLQNGGFDGLNVTIPYKKAVLPFCSFLSDTVRAVGSANTLVRQKDGTLAAYNTDVFGFSRLLQKSGVRAAGKKALVFGSGGAGAAVCHVLSQQGAREVVVISRNGDNNYVNLSRHYDADLLINATPVGMYPDNGSCVVDLSRFSNCCGVVDLIYNPLRTALLQQAEALGIPHADGLFMLTAQAKRSSELFTGSAIADSRIDEICTQLRCKMQNIILIGMPGCGKSTVGKLLAERLCRPFYDSDAEIEKLAGMPIPQVFTQYGEAHFRALEKDVLRALGKHSGAVIATGGGAVLCEQNYAALHQNGTIVCLQRELSRLPTDSRPISMRKSLSAIFAERREKYDRFADLRIDNNAAPEQTVSAIREALL